MTTPVQTKKRAAKSLKYNDWLTQRIQDNPNEAIDHLNAMLEDSEDATTLFLAELGKVAKALGVAQLAEETGLNRENIYDMLSEKGNPRLSSLIAILDAMGFTLAIKKKESKPIKKLKVVMEKSKKNIEKGQVYSRKEAEAMLAEKTNKNTKGK